MKKALRWILVALLALVFILVGGMKLLGVPGTVKEFDMIGFGQWFRYVTGILEVSGAIGMLVARYRFFAALLIAVIMLCATAINIWILPVSQLAVVTAVLMTLALTLAALSRPPQEEKN